MLAMKSQIVTVWGSSRVSWLLSLRLCCGRGEVAPEGMCTDGLSVAVSSKVFFSYQSRCPNTKMAQGKPGHVFGT